MIRTFILLLAGSLWLSYDVQGQDQKKPPETAKSSKVPIDYKWDASVDMYHLFRGHSNVMIRYAPRKKGAYRLGIADHLFGRGKDVFYRDSTGVIHDTVKMVHKMRYYYVVAKVGYEFRKKAGKHQLFYGTDIKFTFHRDRSEPPAFDHPKTFECGLYPFVGFNYRISDRLSVSSEMAVSLSYKRYWSYDPDNRPLTASQSLNSLFDPLSAINITYHF